MDYKTVVTLLCLAGYIADINAAADGTWAEWSDWTSCSVSCGRGVRKRFRACNPARGVGGRFCQGKYVQTEDCDTTVACPVNGGWNDWSNWSACSATCGEGATNRYRSCSNPIPTKGGRPCQGSPQQSDKCFAMKECPRNGGWSKWSQWSLCSVTCGPGGTINRYRSCNNPPPMAEGKPCEGPTQQTKLCKASQQCPVNGQWSEWTEWTECSVSCGMGERTRIRACDQPAPQHGGFDCDITEAGELQTISCASEIRNCPGQNHKAEQVTEDCLRCICEASTECDEDIECQGRGEKYCGPYQISYLYWIDGGELSGDFERCVEYRPCAEATIRGYMDMYRSDCNGDKKVDCYDYALIHKSGGPSCNNTWALTTDFWMSFDACYSHMR